MVMFCLPLSSESLLAGYDSFLIGNRSGPTDWRNYCYLYKLVFIHLSVKGNNTSLKK